MDVDIASQMREAMRNADPTAEGRRPLVNAVVYIRQANTGAQPLLVQADDGRLYWVKGMGNPHGARSLVNEWVVAQLARHLDAPVPPSELIAIEDELLTSMFFRDGTRMRGGVWFGSQQIDGVERDQIDFILNDGNPRRIPYYLALWHLCLGADTQLLYEKSRRDKLWSIDHGLWLDNLESPGAGGRELRPLAGQRWPEPDWAGIRRCDVDSLRTVADGVESTGVGIVAAIMAGVPVEWDFPEWARVELGVFLAERRTMVATHLRWLANTWGGR